MLHPKEMGGHKITGDVCNASGVMNPNIKRVSIEERQVMDGVNY